MKKYILFVLILTAYSSVYSQLNIPVKASVSNIFRYGNGYEYIGNVEKGKEYFENLTDTRLNIGDVTFGLRYEISDPIEYGLDFKGIRKRYVEYKNKDIGLSVRGGDFFDIISRGMTMNVFEDRAQGYDTGIDGVRVVLKQNLTDSKNPIKLKALVMGGDIKFSDNLNPSRIENYKVRDANVEISPIKNLTFGTNYVYSKGVIPNDAGINSYLTSELPEGYMTFSHGTFEFFASYAYKHTIVDKNTLYPVGLSSKGDGFYSSVSYTAGSVGMTMDYKNYRFDLTAPNYRNSDRATKMLPFQNPPTGVKEHYFTLITRNPHVVNFNDEVGAQLDFFWVKSEDLRFNLNGSVASNHYQYNKTGIDKYQRVDRSSDFIPSLDASFNPWYEAYLETEWNISKKVYTKFALSRQYSVIYNPDIPTASEKRNIATIPLEIKYYFTKEYALKIDLEQQWENNTARATQQTFTNQLISLNLTKSPHLGFTLNIEFTNDEELEKENRSWIEAEISYKMNPSNTFTISYGEERGGLRCTNGVCRYVNPFEGARITIQTLF